MAKESNTLPTGVELSGEMLLAPTEERREAAKRLLALGACREPTKDEAQALHPYFIAEKYKGSDSPVMRSILEFVATLPVHEPLAPEEPMVEEILPQTPVPALPAPEPEPHTLEATMKAAEVQKSEPAPPQQPVKLWKPEIPKGARPAPWIDFSNNPTLD
jgi:hypothetical protein